MNVLDELLEAYAQSRHDGCGVGASLIYESAKKELADLRKQRNDYMEWNVEQGKQISALKAAGDAMAERLRSLRRFADEIALSGITIHAGEGYEVFTDADAEALKEWEGLK